MIAFASCAYGLFGTHLSSYATFAMSVESLLAAFVGARMFSNMETETTPLGRVFFVIFVCVMLFVMTNMLISIINEAMDTVNREMGDEIKNDAFLRHVGGKIRDLIGLDSISLWSKGRRPMCAKILKKYLRWELYFQIYYENKQRYHTSVCNNTMKMI